VSRWTEDTIFLIERLITKTPVILVGSGVGGWISLLVASKRPDLVAGLVTVRGGRVGVWEGGREGGMEGGRKGGREEAACGWCNRFPPFIRTRLAFDVTRGYMTMKITGRIWDRKEIRWM